ncbi:MAG TPA: hypothetical protein VEA35_00585 [Ramlibacter sp.]|nr:hypothetical protein [Ramlibacter sp.]
MKTLSLWQPWASLIAAKVKAFETRSWAPPQAYWPELIGGRIAIHASGRKIPQSPGSLSNWMAPITPEVEAKMVELLGLDWREAAPRGQVLCTARLAGVYQVRDVAGVMWQVGRSIPSSAGISEFQPIDPWGDFTTGRWIWWLQDVRAVTPPAFAKGHQKLWNWTPPAQEQAA